MKNILSGKWVFDSHFLVYSQDRQSPFYKETSGLFSLVLSGGIEMILAQQNILEAEKVLISVYHKTPVEVVQKFENIILNYNIKVITPQSNTYEKYHDLIIKYGVSKDFFDYYLAATMLDNGYNRLLTLNMKDFSKIEEIEAVNPFK